MRLVNEDARACVCNSAPWRRQRGCACSALCVRRIAAVWSALRRKKPAGGRCYAERCRKLFWKVSIIKNKASWLWWPYRESRRQQTGAEPLKMFTDAMKICHCIIITSIQGLPLNDLITSPLVVVQNDASHTCTDVSSFTGVPVVSLQWFPVSTCVCRAGFNLCWVPAEHNEGSVLLVPQLGPLSMLSIQLCHGRSNRATFDFRF